jgi:hypothetical protein
MRMPRALVSVVFLASWLLSSASWAADLDRKALKQGLSLPEVVQAIGQPDHIEWLNVQGQAVLFVFYDTDGKDVIKGEDGRTFLPLGFVTERLAGWGKRFYEQAKSPK